MTMTREDMVQDFSDTFKLAYGYRPRNINFYNLSYDELSKYYNDFELEIDSNDKIREAIEIEAIEDFKNSLKEVMSVCSCTKEKAIEYLMDAENVNGDWDYFCFLNNLPYNYKG